MKDRKPDSSTPIQSRPVRDMGRLHGRRIMNMLMNALMNMRMRVLLQICRAQRSVHMLASHPESGMATAEYAVVLIAATGFAGLLVAILKSGAVKSLLTELVTRALNV
ncbi:MAG: DUF4244 domain-containing protein [Bifidobacterium sp.]|uniref:DUF4244 domain-containing protein n=1 Tax=Bifidobacterium fermentum TaxID=3059035 RepID=A0AB39UJQ9_9BIFI